MFCFQDAVLFAALALHRALKLLATLWCTLWWSWPQESPTTTAVFRSSHSLSWLTLPCPVTVEASCKRYQPLAHLKTSVCLFYGWGKSISLCLSWPVCTIQKVVCASLFQNNFLQAFPSVPVPKSGGSKAILAASGSGSLLGLWLKLLVNLSFAEDGQQSILRVSGALELLADLAQHRRSALLVLHNLCFCPANKPHVIANGTKIVGLITAACAFVAHIRTVCSIFPYLCCSQYTWKLIRCSCWEIAAKKQISVETDICWCLFVCGKNAKKLFTATPPVQTVSRGWLSTVICCVNEFPLWLQHTHDVLSRKKCDRKKKTFFFSFSQTNP